MGTKTREGLLKSTLRWSAMAGLALALVVTGAPAAQAESSPFKSDGNTSTVARTLDGRAITNAKIAKEVTDFWTEERMASAVDLTFARSAKGVESTIVDAKPDGPAGAVAPVAPSLGSRGDVGLMLNESQAVGKVYFTTPTGGTASCSASTVASGKRRLVMTAGHCVHQGPGGQWYSNWQFVPRYRNGVRPYGTFVANSLNTRTAWITSGSFAEDMGIAIMNNGGIFGAKVVDTVGGHGLRWNYSYSVYVTALGYPSNLGGGESQYYCQGTTWNPGGQQIRMYCNMTYGSSGGPWLQEYNDSTGYGYINSVVSHGDNPGNGQFDGPYFDNDIKSLYDFAEGLSPA
ncbi:MULTISPECIES: trypsin-like serine peptidase [unclassified Micromonospora]|uniref:trypsin-like serine peptidase n=1 Tax=unclassified Micromonospora TaxID=2617518 RepID=UPI003A84158E